MRRKVYRVARELQNLFRIYMMDWIDVIKDVDYCHRQIPGKGFATNLNPERYYEERRLRKLRR